LYVHLEHTAYLSRLPAFHASQERSELILFPGQASAPTVQPEPTIRQLGVFHQALASPVLTELSVHLAKGPVVYALQENTAYLASLSMVLYTATCAQLVLLVPLLEALQSMIVSSALPERIVHCHAVTASVHHATLDHSMTRQESRHVPFVQLALTAN
jgi:hypothetical protein